MKKNLKQYRINPYKRIGSWPIGTMFYWGDGGPGVKHAGLDLLPFELEMITYVLDYVCVGS